MSARDAKNEQPIRGMSCEMAATYIGLGKSKFLQLVADGRMPPPVRIDRRTIWDRAALDHAFEQLAGGLNEPPQSDNKPIDDGWANVSL